MEALLFGGAPNFISMLGTLTVAPWPPATGRILPGKSHFNLDIETSKYGYE
jgi:hypothetical protein